MPDQSKPQVVLCILDGVGWRPDSDVGNAIALAQPDYWPTLFARYPHTTLHCSGLDVGLPVGQMGNSEVGHLTIGSGRVIDQEINRVSRALASGEFGRLPAWTAFLARIKASGGGLHLLGLVSPGGVHSHTDHLYGIIEEAARADVGEIFVHAFLDGRDTDPHGGLGYIRELEAQLTRIGAGRIASVSGRYYAMDRDQRWDRVEKPWRALVHGEGVAASGATAAVEASYAAGVTDEFVLPTVIHGGDGRPLATVDDGDGVFFWNFRADRARELAWAFNQDDFAGFARPQRPAVAWLCLNVYDESLSLPVLFTPHPPRNILADVFAAHGVTNLRVAETEKYAHVTYFFNGGREQPYPGETRVMIPSPKVATYDLQPEMNAAAVARAVSEQAASGQHDVIVVNFANGDMVGHTGVLEAAIAAFRTLDGLLAELIPPIVARGGTVLVTADHGNCEEMLGPEGQVLTAHSLNVVPLVAIAGALEGRPDAIRPGRYALSDLAPTILKLLNLPQPPEMTGRSVL